MRSTDTAAAADEQAMVDAQRTHGDALSTKSKRSQWLAGAATRMNILKRRALARPGGRGAIDPAGIFSASGPRAARTAGWSPQPPPKKNLHLSLDKFLDIAAL
jgi:hypothetical protein